MRDARVVCAVEWRVRGARHIDFVLEFAAALGLALLLIGWRGRRIDRHPLCAACGFDLFGTRRGKRASAPSAAPT